MLSEPELVIAESNLVLEIFSPSFHFLYGSLTGCFNSNNINYVLLRRVIISCNINLHQQILLTNTLFSVYLLIEKQLTEDKAAPRDFMRIAVFIFVT